MACFMCTLNPDSIVAENDLAYAVRDVYPVSPGHTLIITKRHSETWFDATGEERSAVLTLVDEVRSLLVDELHPDGFNIGVNVGEAAGQTVPHLHIHVIPRFSGDVDDPTGGVRLVIPDKGNYREPGFIPSSAKTDEPGAS